MGGLIWVDSKCNYTFLKGQQAWHQFLMLVILAPWEAEIRRIVVQGQLRQRVHKTPISKNNQSKMDWRCSSPPPPAHFHGFMSPCLH
jgi:hypothetical protein